MKKKISKPIMKKGEKCPECGTKDRFKTLQKYKSWKCLQCGKVIVK